MEVRWWVHNHHFVSYTILTLLVVPTASPPVHSPHIPRHHIPIRLYTIEVDRNFYTIREYRRWFDVTSYRDRTDIDGIEAAYSGGAE